MKKLKVLAVVVFLHLPAPAIAQNSASQYTISTLAGGALRAGPLSATAVSIGNPTGIAVDSTGNVYFTGPNVVFKLTSAGLLTRVAGTGAGGGYSGDGGPATQGQLNFPRAYPYDGTGWGDIVSNIAIDPAGNLYVADMENNRVRKVSTDGIITTVAETTKFSEPSGVAVDGNGNLYVVSPWGRVWKVFPSGEVLTVSGTGNGCGDWPTSEQCLPYSAATDSTGNLYIADTVHCRVQRIGLDGVITTIAGSTRSGRGFSYCGDSGDGGPATSAQLRLPYGVAVDVAGNVYIADTGNNRVRKVSPDGIITTVAGSSGVVYSGDGVLATTASLNSPHGVAVDTAGNIYIADTENYRIRRVSSDGIITTVAGNGLFSESGDGGPATDAQLNFINEYVRKTMFGGVQAVWNVNLVGADAVGNVNAIDPVNSRVRTINPNGVINAVAGEVNTSPDGAVDTAIKKKAERQNIALPDNVALYIASKIKSNIRERALVRLIAFCSLTGSEITSLRIFHLCTDPSRSTVPQ